MTISFSERTLFHGVVVIIICDGGVHHHHHHDVCPQIHLVLEEIFILYMHIDCEM
jgi:hypothetical protein